MSSLDPAARARRTQMTLRYISKVRRLPRESWATLDVAIPSATPMPLRVVSRVLLAIQWKLVRRLKSIDTGDVPHSAIESLWQHLATLRLGYTARLRVAQGLSAVRSDPLTNPGARQSYERSMEKVVPLVNIEDE